MDTGNASIGSAPSGAGGSHSGASPPARGQSGGDGNQATRVASTVLGGLLLARGLRRDSVGGALMALAGGGLLYRGIGGLQQSLGATTAERGQGNMVGAPADASEVRRSVTIGKPADELYGLWREPQTLSRIMSHVADVSQVSDGRAHWVAEAPIGQSLEWDTEVVEERPGQLVRWQSLPGAQVPNEGEVRFRPAPGEWGTEVTLRVRFDPPGGALGDAVAKRFGMVPKLLTGRALRRFKSLAETGEIPTLERNPSARGQGDTV